MDKLKELCEIIEGYQFFIDKDGICENGCSCGECESCSELLEIEEEYKKLKESIK